MKRIFLVLLCVLIFTGCTGKKDELDQVMALRGQLLSEKNCSFDAQITADYGETAQQFQLACQSNQNNVAFEVKAPASIAGIQGSISEDGGKLTFDDHILAFELLAEGEISPVTAPWILLGALRNGCITSCGREKEYLRVSVDDSYDADALHLDIWLNQENQPVQADIMWKELRILSMKIENFRIESP